MRRALVLVALVGCGVPALKLDFHIDNDPASEQRCNAATCEDIPITCGAVESIRIFDTKHPSAPYISQCQVIPPGPKKNLCTIVQNTLDTSKELPVQTLAVQVVVYPEAMIPKDADGNLRCPTEADGLVFDLATGRATGTITMQNPADPAVPLVFHPAIGGLSYWHPGDDDVTVTLGCNYKSELANSTCDGSQDVNTTVHVYDLDINQSVSTAIGQGLLVGIGEPTHVMGGTDIQFELRPTNTTQLDRTQDSPPKWTGDVTPAFTTPYCVEVIDQQETRFTPLLTCQPVDMNKSTIDTIGYRLTSETIDELLRGRYGTENPPQLGEGITIGVVYQDSTGAKNHVVSTMTPNSLPSTIHYLDPRTCALVNGLSVCQFHDSGATATTDSGYFIADAMDNVPFGTMFSTVGTKGTVQALGGNVKGKITIVVLQFSTLPNQ